MVHIGFMDNSHLALKSSWDNLFENTIFDKAKK